MAADFTPFTGTITIAPGARSGTFAFSINNDAIVEANETFLASLTGAGNASVNSTYSEVVTINDDEVGAVRFYVNDSSVTEGGTMQITASLDGTTATDTVARLASVNGTATVTSDYTGFDAYFTIPAGQQVVTVQIPTVQDATPEADENFSLLVL